MIWGMTTSAFTLGHVVVSLVGMGAGIIVMCGLLNGRPLNGWTALFLITTAATSASGFAFPFDHLLPSHEVGFVSLVILALAVLARYVLHLSGPWRRVFVVCVGLALYLNVFVGVVQAFEKVSVLNAMAPTQTEPTFVGTQLGVLALFAVLIIMAAKRFRGGPASAA